MNAMQQFVEELPPQPSYAAPDTATPLSGSPLAANVPPPPAATAAPSQTSSASESNSGVHPAAIAGGAAAGAILLCVIVVCCVVWLRWRRRRSRQDPGRKVERLLAGVSYNTDMKMTFTSGTGGTDGNSFQSGKITPAGTAAVSVARVTQVRSSASTILSFPLV